MYIIICPSDQSCPTAFVKWVFDLYTTLSILWNYFCVLHLCTYGWFETLNHDQQKLLLATWIFGCCVFSNKNQLVFLKPETKPEVSLGFPLLSLTRPLWWRYPCDRYIFAVRPWSESMCEETLTRGDVEQLVEKWVKHRWNWRTTVSFWWLYGYSMIHTRKLTWQWKKQAFEDVSPTKHGDVPLSC